MNINNNAEHYIMLFLPEQQKYKIPLLQDVYYDFILHCFDLFSVDAEEIRRLGKRFKKLDTDRSGSLSIEEFMSVPELHQNPLVQRVIEIFDQDGNKEIDFKGT